MRRYYLLCIAISTLFGCKDRGDEVANSSAINQEKHTEIKTFSKPSFTLAEANKLIDLPLHCVGTAYPYKPSRTLASKDDLVEPISVHPIFYGCFDWHSAVHGYWSMVTLLQQFPDMDRAAEVREVLEERITPENVATELAFFKNPVNRTFERTYGWAWVLKLAETLYNWDDPMGEKLYQNFKPLADEMVARYKDFLPKLNYPVRVGEHQNTAFGLSMAYDYAQTTGDKDLIDLIESRARDFYFSDEDCPITWEPGGYDFLSPCLEEVDIMRRVLPAEEFLWWMDNFMPQLENENYHLKVGRVSDRTDGKLVHLDGLNFSRAWVFYGLSKQYPKYSHLTNLANEHIAFSFSSLVGDSYEGGHWLGSFAIYALQSARD